MDHPTGSGTFSASVACPANEPHGSSDPLVLVVGPNLEMTRYITASLAGRYHVAAACDGSEGFAKARALKPDLILAEAVLPQMSATELVRAVRKLAELDSTPIVFLTDRADEEQQMRVPETHAQDFLAKPFAPEELRLRVKYLLATKAARDALRVSEIRFQELFDQAHDGIFIAEAENGRCAAANAAFCKLLGYRREELAGKPLGDLLAEADAPKLAGLRRSLVPGQPHRAEWCLKRSDDTSLPVEATLTLCFDGRWQVIVRDIAQPVRTTPAASPSEAMVAEIYSLSADAIVSVDEAHVIRMFNEAARSIFGYSAEEIVGAPLDRLIPERFRATHRQHIGRFADGEQTARHMGKRSARFYGLRKNGEEFPLDAAISKLELAGRRLLTVSLRDISEQQRSEDEQRLLAETGEILVSAGSDFQRLITDIAHVIVRNIADWCAVDIGEAGAAGSLKFVHSDPDKAALCEALERYPAERGRPNLISDAIHSRRSRVVHTLSGDDLESLAANPEHLRLLRAFDLGSFIVVPLIARDHPLGAIAFGSARPSRRYGARDVRHAEQLASRIAMAVDNARLHEALQRAIHARDDVLGIVAHDLRNPLNAIVLRAHTLRRGGDLPERREQRATASIIRSAMSMHRLIEDLLDVTRLEAGEQLSMDRDTLATSSILGEIVEREQAATSAAHRELRLEADDAPARVWADRTRLLQVFDNLLGNAMKFSRSKITVGASKRDNEALFWVADDGPGISPEDLPRIFDRFWQASKTDRRGAGLGLSIVQGIVRAHGGRVWVESNVDAGTTFYFTLPVEPLPPVSSAR
jgi:PAS domain S-box-containing protein